MGTVTKNKFQKVAPGVQLYREQDGSRSYRVNMMVNGRLLTRTIPDGTLVRIERDLKRPLTEEEEVLECQRLRLHLKRELDGGTSTEAAWERVVGSIRRGIPFNEFVLGSYLPSRVGELSNTGHIYTAKKLARHFGTRPINAIDYDQIREFVNELKMQRLSASRIRDYTGTLSGIFALAVRKNIVRNNPTRRDDKIEHRAIWPKEPVSPRAKKFMKAEEVAILVEASQMIEINGKLATFDPEQHTGNQARFDTRWLGDLISFAFETGIRRGALLKITWKQIRPPSTEYPYWHVSLWAEQVKNRTSRIVPLSNTAREVLEKHTDRLRKINVEVNGNSTIFRGRWGQSAPTTETAWKSVVRKSKILAPELENGRLDNLHFHDLRASWCVDLLSHGANLNEVQMIGGWSTLSAMMRYVRACETNVESVQEALENRRERHKAPS